MAAKRKFNMDFTGVETYQKASEGQHVARVESIEEVQSQGGSDQFKAVFEITKGEDKGCKVFEFFPLSEQSLWKIKGLLQAIGMKADGKVKLDLDKIEGKICIIEVVHEEYNGSLRAKIAEFRKLEAGKAAKKDEPDDEDDDDEDDDEDEEEEKTSKKSKKDDKKSSKKEDKKSSKKSKKDEDEDEDDDDDEDDEDEDEDDDDEEEEKSKKSKSKDKGKSSKKDDKKSKKSDKKSKKSKKDDDDDEDEDDDEDWEEA